ncbi:hypothetical protein Tco_0053516 [Tanacetum coccineum]
MQVEPDIENMTLEEYLKYESEKESRLWRSVRSKGSPTRYEGADVDSFHQDKSRTLDYPYYYEDIEIDKYYELPHPHPYFQPPQPYTKAGLGSPNESDEVDIDSMTIAEYELYVAKQSRKMGEVDIDTLTIEQYLALTRGNQAPGVVKPAIKKNVNFEIKSQFMRELREGTFSGNKNDDTHEHVEKDTFRDNQHVGFAIEILHPEGLDTTTRKLLDSQGSIPGMKPARALESIQTLADYSLKWHDGSIRTSNGRSDGIASITSKLDSLGRDMKKLKKNVYAIQVGCEICKGAHLDKDCPLNKEVKGVEEVKYGEVGMTFPNKGGNGTRYHMGPSGYYTRAENRPSFGEIRTSLEETINNYLEESAKKQAEHDEWLKKFQENTKRNLKHHDDIV